METLKKILLLLGGTWHDFEGFSQALKRLLEPDGYSIEPTYQLDRLLSLEDEAFSSVVSYTCLGKHRQGYADHDPEGFSQPQTAALSHYLSKGGGFLAVHAATVLGDPNPAYTALVGGEFIEHPPQFSFTLYPFSREHPITAGIDAFSVHDEFYKQKMAQDAQVHLVAVDRGVAHPMLWTKTHGQGKVVHLAPGHDQGVWQLQPYQRLVRQSLSWIESNHGG